MLFSSYSDQTQHVCSEHPTFKLKFNSKLLPPEVYALFSNYPMETNLREIIFKKSPTSFQSVSQGLTMGSTKRSKNLRRAVSFEAAFMAQMPTVLSELAEESRDENPLLANIQGVSKRRIQFQRYSYFKFGPSF